MTKLDFASGSHKVLAIEYNFITFENAVAYWNDELRKASNLSYCEAGSHALRVVSHLT